MKTVGERIRQARIAREISGERLAHMVGFKNQSAVGNLESRNSRTGGRKVGEIARALRVPLEWLINGPDSDTVPFSEPSAPAPQHQPNNTQAREPSRLTPDASMAEVVDLFRQLNTAQRLQAIAHMRGLLGRQPEEPRQENGPNFPPPQARAA